MKSCLVFILFAVLSTGRLFSQVAVNTDGSAADPSAMLDVKSTTKGMLVPRMTIAERDAIANPATGLLVFCTGSNQYFINKGTPAIKNWVMLSSQWVSGGSNIYFNDGNAGIGTMFPEQKLSVGGNIAAHVGASNSAAFRFGDGSLNSGMSSPLAKNLSLVNNGVQSVRIDETGRVAVSSGLPTTSAQLDVSSTSQGFLPPRMTTAQRDAIATPAEGLMLYNTDENAINVFNGTSWAPVVPVVCGQPFTDTRNGQVYNTVQIGLQCWMKENMNIGIFINASVDQTNNGVIEKYCFGNIESNCDVYGGLYHWDELMNYTLPSNSNPSGRQGICPTGWHVPGDAEWTALTTYLGGMATAGGKMKETGTTHWLSPNIDATNSSGFTALPGGHNFGISGFGDFQAAGSFWSATESFTNWFWIRALHYNYAQVFTAEHGLSDGNSGRCCKD